MSLKVDYDAIVVGAGFAGLALIHHLKKIGISVKVFDKANDIGGTWAWNRYPGAATDSEGYYYCLSFSKEIMQEWTWSQRYPGREETQRYLHFVADKCDMWSNIELDTEIISAMGMISQPVIPNIKGREKFNGPCFHSSRWPQEDLDYRGKRVGIIGCGASTVQMLPIMAKSAKSVTVFQRTPNFVLPAMQKAMTPDWEKEIKDNYDEIIEKCRNHVFGMAFDSPVGRNAVDTSPEERERIFEEKWQGSFRWVFETFDDLLADPKANKMAADFVIKKMKEKVNDPKIADLLTPKGYPLFAKRPPLDHGFYESFNRDNVHLVDIKDKEPISEITENGVQTTQNSFDFDIIILATGFQAYTGALEAFDIRGKSGASIKDKWEVESKSIMGVCISDFPNLFTITGPQAPFANLPTSIEQNALWISDCIKKMENEGYSLCEPLIDAEEEWSAHVSEIHKQTLMDVGDQVHSWMMGANIENKNSRVLIYFGGAGVYYDRLRESVDNGFPEVSFR